MAYEYSYVFEEILHPTILSVLFSGIPSSLLGIAVYVLTALGLYTVAQRRGLNRPWLAWIPVINCWIIGSLSDQYRYVVKNEIRSKRKALLVLNLLAAVISLAMIVIAVVMVAGAVGDVMHGVDEDALLRTVMGPVVGILGLCLPMVGIGIAYAIVRYIALYDIYKSMDPGNSVLFLVLSILFGITEPFFLFFNRNKDDGMPPRRQQTYTASQPYASGQDHVPAEDASFYAPVEEEPWRHRKEEQEPWQQDDTQYL